MHVRAIWDGKPTKLTIPLAIELVLPNLNFFPTGRTGGEFSLGNFTAGPLFYNYRLKLW
jgi:hypothetical protein